MSRRAWLVLAGICLLAIAGSACGGGSDGDSYKTATDTADFNDFAKRVARAAEKGDIAFFTDRVVGQTHTCTEEEVLASANEPSAICGEVGQQFQSAVINGFGTQGSITTVDGLKLEIAALFNEALPEEGDAFGTGEVRLNAIAVDEGLQAPNLTTKTALISGIIDVFGNPGRTVIGVDFTWNGERWVIESILQGNFPIGSELLDAQTATVVYEEWAKFE